MVERLARARELLSPKYERASLQGHCHVILQLEKANAVKLA
jgi:hypothetical protein